MATATLRTLGGEAVEPAAVAAFARSLEGRVILPGDTEYESARRIWNAYVDKRPGLILRCAGVADVVTAVRFAHTAQVRVSVRGGGHNVAGRALCDDGLVIDLSAMTQVTVDPAACTVRVQGGATLGDLDAATHVHGLAVPVGVVSRTGVAGLTLGGGVGWLVRKYGLACDNLLACELVTAEGEVLTASADSHPDLFWALRGGGGNFGVVTSFLFRAHPVATVLGGMLVHPRERARDLLRHYRAFMVDAPEDLTAYAAMISTPDGQPACALIACWSGDLAEGERVLRPLRGFGPPLADTIQPLPFPQMQRMLDDAFPDGTRNYWKSTFIRELGDQAIDTIVEHADRMTSPLSGVVVEYYAGAAGRVGREDTAFAAREAEYDIGFMAQWRDPAEDALHVGWARAMADAMAPYSSGRYLLNFLSEEGPETIRAAFGANHQRLAEIKRRYDPGNFFSVNQNIRPAA